MARLNRVQLLLLSSLILCFLGIAGLGEFVATRIEDGIVRRSGITTALYVESVVAHHLQELAQNDRLSDADVGALQNLFQSGDLGRHIVAFKGWSADGRVMYSNQRSLVGRVYPVEDRLHRAWRGETMTRVSSLDEDENALERQAARQLVETYSPVYQAGTHRVIAVAEVYERADALKAVADIGRVGTWLILGAIALLLVFLAFAGTLHRLTNPP